MSQLALRVDVALDALTCLSWRGATKSDVRLRDLFVGALHLGEQSNSFACGWWRRELLAKPAIAVDDDDEEAAADFDRAGRRTYNGWQWFTVAYVPERRIVEWREVCARNQRGRERRYFFSPPKQLAHDGLRLFCEGLATIRAELEAFTGTTEYTSEESILDGLRGMPDHWARAMIALHALAVHRRYWTPPRRFTPPLDGGGLT